jgi:hypothetical protein
LKIKIEYIIIALLVIALLLQRACSSSQDENTTSIKTEIKWDTIKTEVPKYIPKWSTRTEIDIDTFTTPIDTLAILTDYYAIYNYSDTVGTDSVQIVINDTISTNKITSRSVKYNIMYPTITITKTTTINKPQLFYGISVGTKSIGPEVLYKSKKNHTYGLGVGINDNLQPNFAFRMYWSIGK